MTDFRSLRISLGLLVAFACSAQAPQPDGGGVPPGSLPTSWRTGGPTCGDAPEWEIHAYNPDLYILRENACVNYEKPFLYLFFGNQKALLIDTGAGEIHVASAVSEVIDERAARNHRETPPLMVGHSHAHRDHTAGDAQFKARSNTTVVPLTVEATMKAYDIARWPEALGKIDLAARGNSQSRLKTSFRRGFQGYTNLQPRPGNGL
jgi:glyoxylase-like metal-dependent hydrolase (beta-lactamase superfamily II)